MKASLLNENQVDLFEKNYKLASIIIHYKVNSFPEVILYVTSNKLSIENLEVIYRLTVIHNNLKLETDIYIYDTAVVDKMIILHCYLCSLDSILTKRSRYLGSDLESAIKVIGLNKTITCDNLSLEFYQFNETDFKILHKLCLGLSYRSFYIIDADSIYSVNIEKEAEATTFSLINPSIQYDKIYDPYKLVSEYTMDYVSINRTSSDYFKILELYGDYAICNEEDSTYYMRLLANSLLNKGLPYQITDQLDYIPNLTIGKKYLLNNIDLDYTWILTEMKINIIGDNVKTIVQFQSTGEEDE